jgi:S-layer protein
VTAITAAPGVQPVAGVTAVNSGNTVAASAAVTNTPIVADGAVTITDKNHATTTTASNSISTVTLANYGTGSSIVGNALTTLSLSGTAGTLAITNAAAASATNNTLSLTLNGLSGGVAGSGLDNTITDTNHEIKTLNVTTATADSTLAEFHDTGLTALNVSGTNVLTLSSVTNETALATIAVSGGAGFNADVHGLGSTLTSFTTTSSGVITATLDAAHQTFKGSTGQDVITISTDALKTITGGSATNNELILSGADVANASFTAANTGTNVTGFTTLGVNDAAASAQLRYARHLYRLQRPRSDWCKYDFGHIYWRSCRHHSGNRCC